MDHQPCRSRESTSPKVHCNRKERKAGLKSDTDFRATYFHVERNVWVKLESLLMSVKLWDFKLFVLKTVTMKRKEHTTTHARTHTHTHTHNLPFSWNSGAHTCNSSLHAWFGTSRSCVCLIACSVCKGTTVKLSMPK